MVHLVLVVVSRIVAAVAAAMFLVVLSGGTLPGVGEGRPTFIALWAAGVAMHKLSVFRDGRGTPRRLPGPRALSALLSLLGVASVGLLAAVLAGLDVRAAAALLAAVVAAKWVLVRAGSMLGRAGMGAAGRPALSEPPWEPATTPRP